MTTDIVPTGAAFDPPYNPDSERDPRGLYEALDASPDDDAATIKARFRKMSRTHHPDKGGDAQRYAAINAAHDVLSDPAKRKVYDDTGCLPLGGDKVRTLAMNLLTQMFSAYVDQCPDVARNDPKNYIKHAVAEEQRGNAKQLKQLDANIKKRRQILKRMKARDDHPLRRHLKSQINALADQRQQFAATAEALAYVLTEIETLGYELDPPPDEQSLQSALLRQQDRAFMNVFLRGTIS